ncbi:MAG TPA: hypothetical protein PLF40_15510 [Kofleriaceae bacterium]|nr:hypothetical protein [Kofleriaceae bacterium]
MQLRQVLAASLLGGAVSCGSVVYGPDANRDSNNTVDVATTSIQVKTLTHLGDGRPQAGTLVSTDAAGNLIAEAETGTAGTATIAIVGGGNLHFIEPTTSGFHRITTIVGVQPGDALTFGMVQRPVQISGAAEAMAVTYPLLVNGTFYSFFTPCGVDASARPSTLNLNADCHKLSFPLLGTAAFRGLTKFAFQQQTFVANGTAAITTWTDMSPFSILYSNTPANIDSLVAIRASVLSSRLVGFQTNTFGDPTQRDFTVDVQFPPGVGTQSFVATELGRASMPGLQRVEVRTATLSSSLAVDLAAQPLPWIATAPVATATGATWTVQETGTPDMRRSVWSGNWMQGPELQTLNWIVYDDSASATLSLPVLPAKFATVDPRAQAVTNARAEVTYFDFSTLTGFATLRLSAESLGAGFDNNAALGNAAMVVRTSFAAAAPI